MLIFWLNKQKCERRVPQKYTIYKEKKKEEKDGH